MGLDGDVEIGEVEGLGKAGAKFLLDGHGWLLPRQDKNGPVTRRWRSFWFPCFQLCCVVVEAAAPCADGIAHQVG